MPIFEGSSILITGGTGSFGKAFLSEVLAAHDPARVAIYSRDELKQYEMKQTYGDDPRVRFFIGDIRDRDRLKMAMHGVDYVVHAAALKQVDTAEYNPMEYVKTNILGSENVMLAAIDSGVKKVVALSTDKASSPVNLYGATKLTADKLFISGNHYSYARGTRFAVVRYGNVMGSRGSVIPFFLERRKSGVLPITDPAMTRFNITLEEGVDLVFFALERALGGEIFVPKIPSYRITELAEAIGPECKHPVVGIRPGEKVHEEMVTSSDSLNTIETDRYYVIVPNLTDISFKDAVAKYMSHYRAKPVEPGFRYSSGANDQWLTVDEIRALIRQHLDSNFKVA